MKYEINITNKNCRNRDKDVSISTKTYINLDQKYCTRNNSLGAIFFSTRHSHTKALLVLIHLDLEGVTELKTDPKGRILVFKVTPSNGRVLVVRNGPTQDISQRSQGKFFLSFPCTLFSYFLDLKNYKLRPLRSDPGLVHFSLLSFYIYTLFEDFF